LIYAQVGDVEGRRVHVVRGELVAQGAVAFRRGHRQVVQLQLVPLLPIDGLQHLLQHLGKNMKKNSSGKTVIKLQYRTRLEH